MRPQALTWLCCPADRSFALEVRPIETSGDDILTGHIRCSSCGAEYPISGGIPHMMSREALPAEVIGARMLEQAARDVDSTQYDETLPSWHTMIEIDAFLSAISPKPDEALLDLGAGTGRLTLALARRGAYVVAVDLSPRMLRMNRRKCAEAGLGHRVDHVLADACRLPLRTSIFDKVASACVLEHISPQEERARCIQEIHRVLRPSGRMAITVYNYSWTLRRRRSRREGFHEGDLYFYRFDRAELLNLLACFRKARVSGILNLPSRLATPVLDRLIRAVPPVAVQSADLLFAVAHR